MIRQWGETSCFPAEVSGASMFMTSSSSRNPLNKVNGGRDHVASFVALSECHSDDLELPLAPVCRHVTIMIRIDDRTFWFHCLAKGTGEEICWIWTFVWIWQQKWYVEKWFLLFPSGFSESLPSVAARCQGQREWPCRGREITDLKEKFSSSSPLGELC